MGALAIDREPAAASKAEISHLTSSRVGRSAPTTKLRGGAVSCTRPSFALGVGRGVQLDLKRVTSRFAPLAGLALALAAGAALRLMFHADIEWKADEQWSFFHARQMLATGVWPAVGMPSSVGALNPGLSLWVFAGLAGLTGARTPPDLAAAVQAANVLALLAFAAFALVAIPRPRREPWLWAAALWAVNPVAIILERKIWPPSVLPLASVGLVWAWWYRRHPLAAFAWGALGALMAQVHMGVAFLAVALAAWTAMHDRKAFPWKSWLAGSLVGALPAIPWLLEMLRQGSGAHSHLTAPSVSFYMRWFAQFFGYGAQYTLGGKAFGDYLAGPRLDGLASHAMLALQIVLALAALLVLIRVGSAVLGRGRMPLRTLLLGDSPETVLITAAFWGYGGLLTLITVIGAGSYRHYMIVITPIMALWTAMAVIWACQHARRFGARPLLATLVVCQALMSFGLLAYIHQKGVIPGEFGAAWRVQQPGPPAG